MPEFEATQQIRVAVNGFGVIGKQAHPRRLEGSTQNGRFRALRDCPRRRARESSYSVALGR